MANTKRIRVVLDAPFDWPSKLTAEEGRLAAVLLLQPSMGLDVRQTLVDRRPNEHGGVTAIYRFEIAGSEALSIEVLARFLRAVLAAGATLGEIDVYDLDGDQDVTPAVREILAQR